MKGTAGAEPSSISEDEVGRIADLARLELSREECSRYAVQLGLILGYVQNLSRLDTDSVEPLAHVLALTNVAREDRIHPSLPREQVLANAPDTDGVFYRVPRIIE